jgi:NAD dependent epimerase/dehydratase family enzyme
LELIFGELSIVLWGGGFVTPKVLLDNGFVFKHTGIEAALKDLLKG